MVYLSNTAEARLTIKIKMRVQNHNIVNIDGINVSYAQDML